MFAEPTQRDLGGAQVVVEVVAVLALGGLGRLARCFEEVCEMFERARGRVQDLVEELGGVLVRVGRVQPVGEAAYSPGCGLLGSGAVGPGGRVSFRSR
ncbi:MULTISPECIES: hypothetical protein [unclassified Streptomyces]|uniref:hypothetical protein n=1 Tax=unclassified Streptomyces TaxID=2593676 RepID=UPI00236549C9|nr:MULTISPECIES: hypothetical protein [unclassified Streptomyces]MDF3148216.1 hypothetical protein [Streptomyces sp. T21Q-yed]WDF43522.1 hypothetical protein PBV52_45480 [Streptomyces sp. T12]